MSEVLVNYCIMETQVTTCLLHERCLDVEHHDRTRESVVTNSQTCFAHNVTESEEIYRCLQHLMEIRKKHSDLFGASAH